MPGSDSDGGWASGDLMAEAVQKRLLRFGPRVEVVLFAIAAGQLSVLLTPRTERPEVGKWALPGDLVYLGAGRSGYGEELEETAVRAVAETGLEVPCSYLDQLRTYGGLWRHPQERAFSTVYVATTPMRPAPSPNGGQAAPRFFAVAGLAGPDGPQVGFDHSSIIADAVERVRGEVGWDGRLAASFLDQPFSIPGLRRVYEAVWAGPVHRGDFRRKVLSAEGFLVPVGELDTQTGGPPADLYRLGPNHRFHPPMARDAVLAPEKRSP